MADNPGTSVPFAFQLTLLARAKALGLAIFYLVVVAALVLAAVFGLAAAGIVPAVSANPLALPQRLLREWAETGGAVLALVSLAVLTGEPISRLGFALKGAWRDLPIGLAAGFLLMAGSLGVIAAMGGCDFGGATLPLQEVLKLGAFYVLYDFAVAVLEETVFRSFILVQLSRAFSFWPAAVITAALFGLAHAGNINEAPFGLLMAGLFGLALAYSMRRSGALWFAIGAHFAYDYAEDFVFGVPDSGSIPRYAWFHTTLHGPDWLTGGKVGPEASLLLLPLPLLLALIARLALPRREAWTATPGLQAAAGGPH